MTDSRSTLGTGAFGPEPAHDRRLGAMLRDVAGETPHAAVHWSALADRITSRVAAQMAAPWWSYATRWERRVIPLALAAGLSWYLGNLTVDGTIFVNHTPVVSAIAMAAQSGVPAPLKIIGGKHPPTDAEGDAMTVTSVGYTSGNGATVTTDGINVTYTAAAAFTGADSFTYTVTDSKGGSSTATVSVTVTAAGEGFNRLSPPSPIGNGTVVLSYLGVPGYNYALDWATNLAAPINWMAVSTNTAGATGSLNFTNTSTEPANYFRTRYVP